MLRQSIAPQIAALLLKKLGTESIPVVASLVSAQGLHAKIFGFIGSVPTDGCGIVISGTKGQLDESPFLRVQIRNARFKYGDKREFDDVPRHQGVSNYGDAILVAELPSGSSLTLTFTL